MACTAGHSKEPSGFVKVMGILNQSFGSCVLKKEPAPWSIGEVIPMHATKASGEAE
jgi:hypothetical protein